MTTRSYLLTDSITVRGNSASVPTVTQDASQWLDLAGAGDATIWIECFDLTGTVVLNLQSSAFLDESTFALAAPPVTLTPSQTPVITKTVAAVSVAGLARFFRWSVTGSGGAWSATFRIRVMTNRVSYFRPTQVAGCVLWLRSDLGVSLSGTSVTVWADQSGKGNNASQGAATPTYSLTGGVNGLPRLAAASASLQYMTGTFPNPGISTHTLFSVVKCASFANMATFAGTDASNNVNSGYAQFVENPTGIIGRAGASTVSFSSATTTDTSSIPFVAIYSTAASSNGSVDMWVNGVSKATAATAFTLANAPHYLLFTLGGGPPVQYPFNGDAYEFIVFNSFLSAPDRLRVHRYLGARYGVSVP